MSERSEQNLDGKKSPSHLEVVAVLSDHVLNVLD